MARLPSERLNPLTLSDGYGDPLPVTSSWGFFGGRHMQLVQFGLWLVSLALVAVALVQ